MLSIPCIGKMHADGSGYTKLFSKSLLPHEDLVSQFMSMHFTDLGVIPSLFLAHTCL